MSCSKPAAPPAKPDLSSLTDDFVYGSLALSPVGATAAGYHEYKGRRLDEEIDDFSAAGIDQQRKFYSDFHTRLAAIAQDSLSAEDHADYQIIDNAINLELLELDKIQSYRHNPTVYVELVGNALFNPFVLEYASLETRYRQIIQRLQKIPALMQQGQANLADAPEVWNRVAREENEGNLDLIDKALRARVPSALKADYDHAAGPALDALRGFTKFLKDDLSKKTSDWRLGKEKYDQKFEYTLVSGKDARSSALGSRSRAEGRTRANDQTGRAANREASLGQNRAAAHHAGRLYGSGQEGLVGGHGLRTAETLADSRRRKQSASDSDTRVHARHLFGRRFQCRRPHWSRNWARSIG